MLAKLDSEDNHHTHYPQIVEDEWEEENLKAGVGEDRRAEKDGFRRPCCSEHGKNPSFWSRNKNALILGTGGALVFGATGAVVGTVWGVHRDKKKFAAKYAS
uniref:Uncharacterized protein n=1 Tax=Rhodosorus marinus TaxID=101924 RepID=A0A7S3E5A8_9RHOD|mmetsp:Transcript_10181/g.42681  ORF Transcript_10181/g.42681 Transcript_10181/m.42681 type:complete len:102 (+) Transcript_10181:196-501(+)|eukprot:CAMPEP_0113968182 /NCGR_PEP_ID=MMETSP0011_2-20120614/9371_1 /TAXON_ID=101924 /ORGANISM="Rhodosorus marinus" /LENGTH=101 /DNA_ID=CAMNT_0000981203 /DNA_START=113 /DNA_END=418 /DNA_ORIENTATION=+ /assembly_acc=CAM_ASM_000156